MDSIRLGNAVIAVAWPTVSGLAIAVEGRPVIRGVEDPIVPDSDRESYLGAKFAREIHPETDAHRRRSSRRRRPFPFVNRCRPPPGALPAISCRMVNEFPPQTPILTILNGLTEAWKRPDVWDRDRRMREVKEK